MGQLRSKYRVFIWMTVVHFLLFLGTRMYRVVRPHPCPPALPALAGAHPLPGARPQMAVLENIPHIGIWHLPMFFPLFVVHKVLQLVWYHHVIKTARALIYELRES